LPQYVNELNPWQRIIVNVPGSDLAWIEYGAGGALLIGVGSGVGAIGGIVGPAIIGIGEEVGIGVLVPFGL